MDLEFELREPELSPLQAGSILKQSLRDRRIRVLPHARKEMIDDGFDDQDLEAAIRAGVVHDRPEIQRTKVGDVVRYKLIGPTAEQSGRHSMVIIFEVPEEDPVPIITVYKVERRRRR